MTGTETLFKDITEIHGRLLEHRPVLQGDVSFFIREFEEKRGDRDLERLKEIESEIQHSVDVSFPNCETLLNEHGQNILTKVRKAVEMCDKIASKEGKIETEFLKAQQDSRALEWADFMKYQFEKSSQVDKDFDGQIEEAEKHYQDLEEKLKLPSP